jgi:hypothetical protein
LMKSAVILDVPMEVEVGVGKNWLEAHWLGLFGQDARNSIIIQYLCRLIFI